MAVRHERQRGRGRGPALRQPEPSGVGLGGLRGSPLPRRRDRASAGCRTALSPRHRFSDSPCLGCRQLREARACPCRALRQAAGLPPGVPQCLSHVSLIHAGSFASEICTPASSPEAELVT